MYLFHLSTYKMKTLYSLGALFLLCMQMAATAQTKDTASCCSYFNCCRPDGQAPLGIMTDHMHGKGQWMVSYSYMNTGMMGMRNGNTKISDDEVFKNYYASPSSMNMQMHMLMLMYGVSDKLSLMAMGSFNINTMNMNMDPTMQMHMADGMNMPPMSMSMKTYGVGDTKLYALYKLADKQNARIIAGLGCSLPTGSIQQKTETVTGDTAKTAYNMQNGTGSIALIPSITYVGQSNAVSWGASANAILQTGANSEGYQWGNQLTGTGWVAYKCASFFSISARLEAGTVGMIKGYDQQIAVYAANDPTANTANYGGTVVSALLGINFYVPRGVCRDLRIAFEFGAPFYQNLNGMQPSLQNSLHAGIRYIF